MPRDSGQPLAALRGCGRVNRDISFHHQSARGTEGQMAMQPGLRIGDRERDAVAAELQEHFARGRLTLEEFNQRLDAVFAAKTQADLNLITSDLPHARSWGSLPSGSAPAPGRRQSRPGGPGRGVMAASF